MYLQKVKIRKTLTIFFYGVLKVSDEIAGSASGSNSQRHGSGTLAEVRIGIRILPFSHKGVERTIIMHAK
jgi:hypothetical protein